MGEPVTYPGHGRDGTGYLARPQGPAAPGVVVVRGAWGLVDHIHTVADRLAEAGYVALALDLDPSTSDGETLESAVAQIVGAAEYLASRTEVTEVALLGFGQGGGLTLRAAPESERVKAVVAFYPLWNGRPLDWSRYGDRAILIHCSDEGLTSTAPDLAAAQQGVTRGGGECTVIDYPGTRRAFFNDDVPEAYDADAAARAWARSLDLLRRRLG